MSAKPKFAHVVLQTAQPKVLRDWYCTVLDGHVVYEDDALCFITYDEEHHRVALLSPPGGLQPKNPAAAGAHHVAYTFENLDDLLDRYVLLRDNGIRPAVSIAHGVTTSLYYRDPDGNFIEMQIDNFAEPEQATDYMRGSEYAADSIGPAFDPDVMLAARKDGASVKELIDRAWALTGKMPDPRSVLIARGEDQR